MKTKIDFNYFFTCGLCLIEWRPFIYQKEYFSVRIGLNWTKIDNELTQWMNTKNKNTKKKFECRVSSLCRIVGPLALPKNLFSRQKQKCVGTSPFRRFSRPRPPWIESDSRSFKGSQSFHNHLNRNVTANIFNFFRFTGVLAGRSCLPNNNNNLLWRTRKF